MIIKRKMTLYVVIPFICGEGNCLIGKGSW